MALNITTIRTEAENIVATALGPAYKELPYQYDIGMNDGRTLEAGYAVTFGNGRQIFNIDQAVNLEQDIIVELVKRVFIRNDDDKASLTLDDLYNACETIIKSFIKDKINLEGTVLRVDLTEIGQPQKIGEGRDIYVIRLEFKAQYTIAY
jgi:hypothetical protein